MIEDHTETEALVARVVDGTCNAEDAQKLLNLCEADGRLLSELRSHLVIERMLALEGRGHAVPEGFTREILAKIDGLVSSPEDFTPRVLKKLPGNTFPFFRRIAAIAAVLVACAGAWLLWPEKGGQAAVAEITGSEAADGIEIGREFHAGQDIAIGSGFVRIRFAKGAEMILEGPAELTVSDGNGAVLMRGTVSVHVPPSATGFTLVGPDAKVIDVGTEFAMKVSPDKPTEVHVLDGLIRTSTSGDPVEREMRKDQAIEVIDGNARQIPAQPGHFVSALPKRKSGAVGYIHWSFDEREGSEAASSGPGIGGSRSGAHLRTDSESGLEPMHVEGVFGAGIFLDGKGAFIETDFRGIGGTGARTVAMWVRIPFDWEPLNGYAMASWGSMDKLGAAWQISVNPGDYGGAVGHLRVGTNQDYAVGNTDLRDGRWHHIAAVMYAGENATAATHVLLYVDGDLETTEVKSTSAIDTDIESESAVKLQLGRNLGTAQGLIQEKNFFRGWIDEVFVADEALSLNQIRGLMKDNRLQQDR